MGAQVAYHALIGLYGKLGQWQKSLDAFRQLEAACQGEPPSGVSYNILLDAMFGPDGADAAISALVQNGERLRLTEGTGELGRLKTCPQRGVAEHTFTVYTTECHGALVCTTPRRR